MDNIQAVLFDWAGTTIDYGCCAPAKVFREIFLSKKIEITDAEARGPMGMAKRDHIAAILKLPRIQDLWKATYHQLPTPEDVDALYREFLPLQKQVLKSHCDIIPGVGEAIEQLRDHGIKIGSTTGYTRELMDVVTPIVAEAGYAPDVTICSDEVKSGRPEPDMNLLAAKRLDIEGMHRVVVVDDTDVGIEAGRRAGAITIAVTQTGNALGYSLEEVNQLTKEELEAKLHSLELSFREAGADHVLRSVAELPGWLLQQRR